MLKEYYYIRETDMDINLIGYYGTDLNLCDNSLDIESYFESIQAIRIAVDFLSNRYPDSYFFIDSFVDEE